MGQPSPYYRHFPLAALLRRLAGMLPVAQMLIVDDEPSVRDVMSRWAALLGLRPHTAASADEALDAVSAHRCDLAVIDVMMPGHDGFWLAGELQRGHPSTAVVIVTGHTELLRSESSPPLADLLIKPFPRERFAIAVDRGRHWHRQVVEDLEWHTRLSREIDDQVVEVCGDLARLRERGIDETAALLALADERALDLAGHGDRVARLSVLAARALRLDEATVALAEQAARLHDVGKIAMPEALITKPSALSPGEIRLMQRHVDAGASILAATASLSHLAPIVGASHERFGGGGYSRGLAGAAIPLASRIIGVADAYDAMTSDRPYRRRLDSAEAAAEVLRCAPSQFDPAVVVAFMTVVGRP